MKENLFKPIGNNVVLQQLKKKTKTTYGVLLPNLGDDICKFGKILFTGPGINDISLDKRIPMEVKVGDIVAIPNFAGQRLIFEHEEYILIKETDILTIINSEINEQ